MKSNIKIAVCNRKTDKKYKNLEMTWDDIITRNRNPIRTTETIKEYPKLSKARRDDAKDQGGFVGGWLKNGIRKNGHITCRTLGTLDADHIPEGEDFIEKASSALSDHTYFIYSTHSHTPKSQRYRIVILFSREVSEDEYPALMRMIAKEIGMDYFDDSTYQANRMMYWASCSSNADFFFTDHPGTPLSPDAYLAKYQDWRDVTQWPTSSRQSEVIKKSIKGQQDPLTKEGVIGAFCRTYHPIDEAISTFLSDIYEPSVVEGRYDFIPADSSAGVVIYDDKFIFSHHASDPASGKLLNAFDLVRIHLYGDDDSKKSYYAMEDQASKDEHVKLLMVKEKQAHASMEFSAEDDEWKKKLVYERRSTVIQNSVWNLNLILNNDANFANFGFNELAGRVQVTGPLPWTRPEGNSFWRDADTAQMKSMIDINYTPFSSRNYDVSFMKVVDDRRFHPIGDYLAGLPEWDGKKRVEDLFIRYLQADDTPYVRAVTRKTFAAAIARIYRPGTKFDSIPVLDGEQGIGKSSIVKDLIPSQYYSETLSITDMNDKSGAEKLQGFWIIEIGELAGMKKADIEKVKAFLSTSDDKYRPSYGRSVESHPRQCIIIGTVNGERGYLRDITGNRRFWIIKVRQKEQKITWKFTQKDRDQFWAEAKVIWESGEKLFLEDDFIPEARQAQQEAMESDDRGGLVREYLNTLLPNNWDQLDLGQRRDYLSGFNNGGGTIKRDVVCNMAIWCECFGKDPATMRKIDSYEIAAIMQKMDNWGKSERTNFHIYGRQRSYRWATIDEGQPLT